MIGAHRGESCDAARVISRAGSNHTRTENGEVDKQTRPPFDPAAHTLSAAPQEALTCAIRVCFLFCHLEGPQNSFSILDCGFGPSVTEPRAVASGLLSGCRPQ